MKKATELKNRIKNAEEMMRKYPEDENLMIACRERIEMSKKELAELRAK